MVTSTASNGKRDAARVALVAAGVISPLGSGLAQTLDSLRMARDCVTAVTRFAVNQCRCKTAGQVQDRWLEPSHDHRGAKRLHRAAHMIIAAMRETRALDAQFWPELTIIGTTSGGMSFGEDYYRALRQRRDLRRAARWIANYPPQKPIIDAQDAVGISAPCQVIANACASGTNAIGHAFECVRAGRYQRVLAGGYDALSELVFVGFDSLQASTPEKCRPFDRDRSGMVIGEGAAILALENLESARARGANVLAEIIGYGISTDNFHLTQPNPTGAAARKAMESALVDAGITSGAIDYINAHGTATPLNDAAEAKAIEELFGEVPVSSSKSMMGHSLGAAGAIEAVVCLLALQHQFLPPNINFRAPDQGVDLAIIANQPRPARLRVVLSNSFGFGGTNASIVMREFDE
ncbi:MAG TPA: beta-ketoacyl-[acyl-carrier-protein] synthase family protein [Chthoniobacterales bacterium]|nr:beta-ketoacyl-[acyl-carrier-protein] synthase family protein [Chthoniobacterales bacterium]